MEVILSLAVIGLAIIILGNWAIWYVGSPGFKGSVGERRVNKGLQRSLPEQDYTIVSDLTLPSQGGTTQIDHIVVSRFGVFVIETKNMQGWIFGKADQAKWTQSIYRKKNRFQNPLHQNYKHVKAVQDTLGIAEEQIYNLVVFVGSAEPRTQMPEDVSWSVRELLQSIVSKQIVIFDDQQVARLSARLSHGDFQTTKGIKQAHIRHVERAMNVCPKCGADLVLRTSKKSGYQFYGCSQFPKCRGTRQIS